MARISCPSDAVDQAHAVLGAWKIIDAGLEIGTVNTAGLEQVLQDISGTLSLIDSLEAELIDLRNRRDRQIVSAWEMVKRVRDGMKGFYGDDSSQYEMVGGTRLSERKPPARKKVPSA